MNQRRLYYRVILKILTALAVIVLIWVFARSLFVNTDDVRKKEYQSLISRVDLSLLKQGEIKKVLWKGREVAVLYRNREIYNREKKLLFDPAKILDSLSRSKKPKYFVYFSHGDSGNCPLFYSSSTFKDVCTGNKFDTTGRQIGNQSASYKLEIPPHYFNGSKLYIGKWDRE